MLKWVDVGLGTFTVLLVILGIGMIIHRSLPGWRQDRRNLVSDIQTMVALSFIAAIAVAFLSFFGMLVAATHLQADISLYVFLGSGIYALVLGAAM